MTTTIDMHDPPKKRKSPRRRDDRVILHFDLDCFYAQCIENQQPALKSLPLGIKQKGILATCNYEARRRGVKKLMQIFEAKRICPELVLADGEDLSPFRDVSKRLYSLLRSYSWCGKIERLGLDEIFMDVTDMITYNADLLNGNSLQKSFFCLERDDPERGFELDATQFVGCIYAGQQQSPPTTTATQDNGLDKAVLYTRLLLASHLARYLRLKIEEEGFTSSCGISTNKLLAKLVGNKNKPRNQTTLLALQEDDVLPFMDEHQLRAVPGIGNKITSILEAFIWGQEVEPDFRSFESSVTVGEVRTHPGISPPALEKLLVGPGVERGLGVKVWCLLHGVDDTAVKPGRDVPTQISIEDTYKGLNEPEEIKRELALIATSLLRRMHVDLVETNDSDAFRGLSSSRKWTAYPKTIRLTTRPYTSPQEAKPYNWARASRSGPLPSFVFSLSMDREAIVEKLVVETLTPMFRKLNPASRGWNIGLINICVTNMSGSDGGVPSGRDIGVMFRRQEDVLREFTVYNDDDNDGGADGLDLDRSLNPATPIMSGNGRDICPRSQDISQPVEARTAKESLVNVRMSPVSPSKELHGVQETTGSNIPDIPHEEEPGSRGHDGCHGGDDEDDNDYDEDYDDESWIPYPAEDQRDKDRDVGMAMAEQCPLCGHFIPYFALTAHERFHRFEADT